MQPGNVIHVRTDKDVDFVLGIAQNTADTANLVPPAALGADGACRSVLKSISILSDQQLAWNLQLYSRNTFVAGQADLDAEFFLGQWSFIEADGTQVAAGGPFQYYIDGLDIPYFCGDFDTHATFVAGAKRPQGQIHLQLVNRSSTSKNAGATGEIVIDLGFVPTDGRS